MTILHLNAQSRNMVQTYSVHTQWRIQGLILGGHGGAIVQNVEKLAKHSVKHRETTAIGRSNCPFCPPGSTTVHTSHYTYYISNRYI